MTTAMLRRLHRPGRATMRVAISEQNRRRASTPVSAPFTIAAKFCSPRTSSTPNSGTRVSTATSAMTVEISPASPNVLMSSELVNWSAMKDSAAVAWVSTEPSTSGLR